MFRRLAAITTTSLLASGALAGFGAGPAAAAAGAPADLLTAGQACATSAPGPYLSPEMLNDARAVTLGGTYSGEPVSATARQDFEYWDVDRPETVFHRDDSLPGKRLYVQIEDPETQLDGVTYAWRARVLDGTEPSPWSDTCYYTVDRTGGEAPGIASADYPGEVYSGGIGVSGRFTLTTASEDTVGYRYRFYSSEGENPDEWSSVDAPALGKPVTVEFTPSASGYHSVAVSAVDRAGNWSERADHQFYVRETRPGVFSAAYPESSEAGCCANLQYNVGIAGEFQFSGGSGADAFEWRIGSEGSWASVPADAEGKAKVSIAPTTAGVQTLYVRLVLGGTRSPERAYRFLVDDGPTITGNVDQRVVIGSRVTLHAKPRAASPVTEYVYWLATYTSNPAPEKFTVKAKADGTADISWLADNSDLLGLYVQSKGATLSQPRWIGLSVNGAAPSITRTGGDVPGSTATFVARTDMTGVTAYTVTVNDDPATRRTLKPAADGSVTFQHTPATYGTYWVRVVAQNAAGISTDDGSTQWSVSNGPTVTSAEFPATGAARLVPGSFTFRPRLPLVTDFRYWFGNDDPRWVAAKPDKSATVSWTPSAAGDYVLSVQSYNGSISSQVTKYRFRVAPAAVKVTSVSPAAVPGGAVRSITLKGANLHRKDVLQVKLPGGRTVTATVKSVSADGTTTTADVNLAGAPLGVASVTVRPYGAGQSPVVLAKAFTVAPQAKPQATKRPTISGTAAVGNVLKAAPGTWSPAATSYAYQWAANGVAIKGATGSTLTVPASVAGKRLTVTVTAKRTGHYSGTSASAATAAVSKGKAPKATKKPKITGTAKAGKKLTVNPGTWSPKADSYRYQWKVNGKVIKGATGRTLTLKSAWRTKKITVTVTTKKAGYADASATSAAVKVR
ncbi:hypothetical protein AB0C07_38110 [Actinoplanes missouriensis]|uniref:hypothetical protein n=1 Tax=Actinoplanes missouriensis TaxID=1866 RepID=UPI0033DD802C